MTAIWGPKFWLAIHSLALMSPRTPTNAFLSCLPYMLPCKECRGHARRYVDLTRDRPRADFFASTVEFHNAVNQRLGKRTWTVDEARRAVMRRRGEWYGAIWTMLHVSALYFRSPSTHDDHQGLSRFWRLLPGMLPPEFSHAFPSRDTVEFALRAGPRAFFETTVAFHNRVNAELGRRLLTPRQAADIWRVVV